MIKGRLRANLFVQLLCVNDEQEDDGDSGETETERTNEWTGRKKLNDRFLHTSESLRSTNQSTQSHTANS